MRRLGWFWAPAQPLLQALPGLSSSTSSRWPLIQWHCKTWIDNNSLLADGRESGLVQIRAGSRQFFFLQEFLIWRCRTAPAALPSYLYNSTKKKSVFPGSAWTHKEGKYSLASLNSCFLTGRCIHTSHVYITNFLESRCQATSWHQSSSLPEDNTKITIFYLLLDLSHLDSTPLETQD